MKTLMGSLTMCLWLLLVGFLQAQENTSTGVGDGRQASDIALLLERSGLVTTMLTIYVLGLALNLTPCVYPMVPITVGFFSQQTGLKMRVLLLALLYVFGIVITYSTLGVVAALTGQMFGAHLQSPWVLIGIAVILVGLALGMFGLYRFQLPSSVMQRFAGTGSVGMLAALAMGLVVGVVAAPCVGPVTAGLFVYVGATGDPVLGFGLFFALALGLGTPYVALAVFSGALRRMPRSGEWMVWVERLFGFMLLGLALYFVSPLLPQTITPWAIFALSLAGGVYLGWLEPSRTTAGVFYWLKKTVGIAGVVVGTIAVMPGGPEREGIAWQRYDAALIQQAKEEGKPVILDFYADWCPPCQEMERTTYRDERVIEASKPFVMIKADMTRSQTPEAQWLLEQFNVSGVPTLAFLNSRGEEIAELRAVGYIGPEEFLQRIHKVTDLR